MTSKNTYILQIAQALVAHHAAVMVGAGFSRNADKSCNTEREFLNWNQLSDLFYERLYENEEGPGKEYLSSLGLAEQVEKSVGRPVLEEILHQAVPDEDYIPSEMFRKLMELPWRDVFTTNYDTLLERAADQITKRRYNVVVCKEDLVNSNDAPRIIKLHGSFPSHRPFIITEEDYRTYPELFAPMVNTVQQALLENIFCMIGFSGEDPNFIKWTGWIRDHLSKSSSQKIYMIAVSSVSEAQRSLFQERNIVVIDLEKMWPEYKVVERLNAFLNYLTEYVEQSTQKENWAFDGISMDYNNPNYRERTEMLRRIRKSYPRWVFLPKTQRAKITQLLRNMESRTGFDKIPLKEQIEYIYEFVEICDIANRPILMNDAEIFKQIVEMDTDNVTEKTKKQEIRLHLMRTCRENGQWEEFEKYKQLISNGPLDYGQKQFYKTECCRAALFRFEGDKLRGELDDWKFSLDDVYWPLIKAYLLAAVGEFEKADKILMDNLNAIRRSLMKNANNVYLVSLEECCVSLINYIRQCTRWINLDTGDKGKYERSISQNSLSLREEREYYSSKMKEEFKQVKMQEVQYNFNLVRTYTINFSGNQEDVFTALEYWRFMEKTGHAFRIGNVTMLNGLDGAVKRLERYYPYWAMVQVLIAGKEKMADLLCSRGSLAKLTQEEADETAEIYVKLFWATIREVSGTDNMFQKNVYDQAASILPLLLSRYACKCSIAVLDEIVDALQEMCMTDKFRTFRKLDELISSVVRSYTSSQQMERLEKFIQFPIELEKISGYANPCHFCEIPYKKEKLKSDVYERLMYRVRQEFQSSDKERKRAGEAFYVAICYLIELEPDDLKIILKQLKEEKEYSILYKLTKNNEYLKEIKESVLVQHTALESKGIFSRSRCVNELTNVSESVDFTWEDSQKWFPGLIKVVERTNGGPVKMFENNEEVRGSTVIAIEILACLYCSHKTDSVNEESMKIIEQFKDRIDEIRCDDAIPLHILVDGLREKNDYEDRRLETDLWTCDERSMGLIENMIYMLKYSKEALKEDTYMLSCVKKIEKVFSYRFMDVTGGKEINLIDFFLCLAKKNYLSKSVLPLLNIKLRQLVRTTVPCSDDTEKIVREKILMRAKTCALAAELQNMVEQVPAIEEWRRIGMDKNEFMEVREVKW